jgi:hypothetical protein
MRRNTEKATQKRRRMFLELLEPRMALAIAGLGVAGDSWSDEYAHETYNYAQNWAELLRTQRGVDLGEPVNFLPPDHPSGDPMEFRRTGTAFNYAYTGATMLDLLIQAQDINISALYTAGEVSHAVLMIGNVDFAPGSEAFNNIANGVWNQFDKDEQVTLFSLNFEAAISALSNVPNKVLVATIPDPTLTPHGRTLSTPTGRAAVSDFMATINSKIKEISAKYHQPVIDLAGLATAILGTPANPATQRTIGGNVYTVTGGTSKTNLFVQGGVLPHTVFNAMVANLVMEGLNFAYGENLPLFTEQQIVTLAGQTYGGTDTFPINYRNYVLQPPVTVYLDYGRTSTPADDFTARMSELATARKIPQLSVAELNQVKAGILSKLQAAFAGLTINFTATAPNDTRYEVIKFGRLSQSVPGALTSRLGQSTFDWLNSNEVSTGFVFPDLITSPFDLTPPPAGTAFDNINLANLSRADQLRYLQNVLSFYAAQEIGRGMGLSTADAYGYSQITNLNADNTGGVQFIDFMLGDPALGFDTSVFNGDPTFTFSPLAKAKLQYGRWLANPNLVPVPEVTTAHSTTATAQPITFTNSMTGSLKVSLVKGASIGTAGQKDLYRVTVGAGDLITAQTFSTGVYGAPIDTVVRLYGPDGTTLLAESDNTLLGINSIGQAGTTTVDTDSLILNYKAPNAGNYYIEVTAKNNGVGNYDVLLTNNVVNNFPWQNPNNNLNVNNSTGNPLITAFDALLVINELNLPQIMDPVTFILPPPSGTVAPPPYLDVNGSNTVTAFDALLVINFLNLNPIGASEFVPDAAGEATDEAVPLTTADDSAGPAPSAEQNDAPTIVPVSDLGPTATPQGFVNQGENGYQSVRDDLAQLLLLLQPVEGNSSGEDSSDAIDHSTNDAALEELLGELTSAV